MCLLLFQLVSELGLKGLVFYNTKEKIQYIKDMEEGFSTNKPPLFRGIKYDYWKERMVAHFESIHINLWDVMENGYYIPYDDQLNEITKGQWTKQQGLTCLLNSKARNVMLCSLSEEEYTKVHNFRSAKQIWDTLAVTYEGMPQVKRNKLILLTHKYGLFFMEENKDIQCTFRSFQTILNELRFFGITYDNYNPIEFFFRSLSKKWRPQVTTQRALKNLDSMSFEELVNTFKVHEQELQQDEGLKREMCLALSSQKNKKAS